jgi:hypothetical protein
MDYFFFFAGAGAGAGWHHQDSSPCPPAHTWSRNTHTHISTVGINTFHSCRSAPIIFVMMTSKIAE